MEMGIGQIMSAEEIQQGISVFLQFGALLGIVSTAIYLFIALKNYTKQSKEDNITRQKEFDEKLKAAGQNIIDKVTGKIEGEIEDVRRDLTVKVEQLNELKTQFIRISEKMEEIDKKCIAYDFKIPELQEIRKTLETIKNAIVKTR